MKRNLSSITQVILHHSASEWGDSAVIDRWHAARGWDGIGYHFVILNGRRYANGHYSLDDDGVIEVGRPLDKVGAHVADHNHDSIGICLIGEAHFTSRQLYVALPEVLHRICEALPDGPTLDFLPHSFYNPNKACPNLDIVGLSNGVRPGCLDPLLV